MKELQKVFEYEGNAVRTVIKNGEPWFVAKDVCEILGIGNVSDVIRRLRNNEKGVDIIDTLGGRQEINIVNEPGLYRLIFTSRKEEAEKFQDWVYHEVLPTIRRTGRYALPSAKEIAEMNPSRLLLNGPTWGKKYNMVEIYHEIDQIFISPDEVARRCGLYTTQTYCAKPHGKFIQHLIMAQMIEIDEDEIMLRPLMFRESLVPKVAEWMRDRDYPTQITFGQMTHRIQFFPPQTPRGYYVAGEYE